MNRKWSIVTALLAGVVGVVLVAGQLGQFGLTNGRIPTAAAQMPQTAIPVSGQSYLAADTTQTIAWTAATAQAANFALSLSEAGDVNGDGFADAIIGADWFDNGTLADAGAVFLFYGGPKGLSLLPQWQFLGMEAGGEVGGAVHAAGDVNNDGFDDVIVGAPGVNNRQGAVLVFHGSAAGLSLVPNWQANGDRVDVGWGTAVSTAGDVNGDTFDDIIFGAPLYDDPIGGFAEGRVFVHYGSATGLSLAPSWVAASDPATENLLANTQFGFAVDTAGDVNGDTFADIIIGAPGFAPETVIGAAFVFYGSANGLQPDTGIAKALSDPATGDNDWAVVGPFAATSPEFGFAVSSAGDVDRNGADDVLVGAPSAEDVNVGVVSGQVYLYSGNVNGGLDPAPVGFMVGTAQSRFGHAVDELGDVDQDGYDDFIVGAPQANEADYLRAMVALNGGAAFVYRGDPTLAVVGSSSFWQFFSPGDNARFGTAVSGLGDVNNDTYADIGVGAPEFANALGGAGQAFAYYGTGPIASLTIQTSSPTSLGNATYFVADFIAGGFADFTWDFGDGKIAVGNPISHTYDAPGQYTATVTAVNDFSTVVAETAVWVKVEDFLLPGQGGSLFYTDGFNRGVGVDVPGTAVTTPVRLQFAPLLTITQPSPTGTIGYYFDLDAVAAETAYLPLVLRDTAVPARTTFAQTSYETAYAITAVSNSFVFNTPITITVFYNQADVDAAGVDEASLTLTYWEAAIGDWVDAATTCSPASTYERDPVNDFFKVQICHLSRFGVVGVN